MKKSKRNLNIDLIRCVAVFSVISVHFFLNNEFYKEIVTGKRMYFMSLMRTLFMVCVPLFLIITGYLMCNKVLERAYYKGITRTLEIFFLANIICLFYEKYYLKSEIWLKRGLVSLFGEYNGYSWYVEMYIGLFLIIPFLNEIYHGLKTKKKKKFLIFIMLVSTTLPSLLNMYVALIPDWWIDMYPLTYYFIGAYLREYDLKISVRSNVIVLLLSVLAFGSLNYYLSYGEIFEWGAYNDWGGFENVIDSVLVFVLLLHCRLDHISGGIRACILKISELSFGTYLMSYVVDKTIYPWFNAHVDVMVKRAEWYILMVPMIFVAAMALSQIINWICDLFEALVRCSKDKLINRQG